MDYLYIFSKNSGEFLTSILSNDTGSKSEYPEDFYFFFDKDNSSLSKYSEDFLYYDKESNSIKPIKETNKTEEELKSSIFDKESNDYVCPEKQYISKLEESFTYADYRFREYPDIGDQLDAVFKLTEFLQETLELPDDVQLWVSQLREIKDKYPKTEQG